MKKVKTGKIAKVPNLRFPGFEGEWEEMSLGSCSTSLNYGMNAAATKYDGENKYIRITDIDDQTSNYRSDDWVSPAGKLEEEYLVQANDILLARTGASTGKTYIYSENDGKLYFAGFLIRARISIEHNARFVFYQTQNIRYQRWVGLMSMRSGQPGINSQEYSSYKIYLPNRPEQDKISMLMSVIDSRINTQNKIIEDLKSLINNLITSVRDSKKSKGWEKQVLRQLLNERNEKNAEIFPVHSVSVHKGIVDQIEHLGRSFSAKTTDHYNVVHTGDIVYTKSPTGDFPYGIVKQCFIDGKVAVSPLYGVYEPRTKAVGTLLHYYFSSPVRTTNYLHSLIQKGAKNTINITNQNFLSNEIILPTDKKETNRIALALERISKRIDIEEAIREKYTQQKIYLLNNLFI
jgi:type I restriction enzyme S subunit